MPQKPMGIRTIAGFLTAYLDEVDLSRKELAQMAGVSVRTIHNIEHGRKRVDRQVLARIAAILNERSQRLYPAAEPLGLTVDHFVASPVAAVNVALQAICLNRPDFLLHDEALVDPSLRWWVNGDPDRLPWTGLFDLRSVSGQINTFHRCFALLGVEGTQDVFFTPRQQAAIVKAVSHIRHPGTGNRMEFRSYIEFDVAGGVLRSLESTFDSERVAAFLESGVTPRERAG